LILASTEYGKARMKPQNYDTSQFSVSLKTKGNGA